MTHFKLNTWGNEYLNYGCNSIGLGQTEGN